MLARYFFRVIETDNGLWICRRGVRTIDHHRSQESAISHMTQLAAKLRPSRVFLQTLQGGRQLIARFD